MAPTKRKRARVGYSPEPDEARQPRDEEDEVYHLRLPTPPPHSELFIPAYEATLLYNQPHLAHQVAARNDGESTARGRMQRWGVTRDDEEVWVDRYAALPLLPSTRLLNLLCIGMFLRYDVLNLLVSLPSPSPPTSPTPSSEGGFTDLGSDAEEMFYFAPTERDQVQREKKRRKLDSDQEKRMSLMAKQEEEGREEQDTEVRWISLQTNQHERGLCFLLRFPYLLHAVVWVGWEKNLLTPIAETSS